MNKRTRELVDNVKAVHAEWLADKPNNNAGPISKEDQLRAQVLIYEDRIKDLEEALKTALPYVDAVREKRTVSNHIKRLLNIVDKEIVTHSSTCAITMGRCICANFPD